MSDRRPTKDKKKHSKKRAKKILMLNLDNGDEVDAEIYEEY